MKSSPKSIKKNLLLLMVSTLFGLMLMEFTLRLISLPLQKGVGTVRTPKAEIYGWAPLPNSPQTFINPDTGEVSFFATNSQGWKDVEHQFEKPKDVIRILFLGDSATWGWVPMDDLYTRQVELLLKEKGFFNVEVISIGLGGWGADQSLEALQVEGIKYQPDIVVYQFCGNDVGDILAPAEATTPTPDSVHSYKRFKYKLVDGMLEKVKLTPISPPDTTLRKLKRFLLKSALIYNLDMMKDKMIIYLHERTNRKKYEALKTKHWWGKGENSIDPLSTIYRDDSIEQAEVLRKGWGLLETLIIRMKQISEENNAKFIVFSEEGENGKRIWRIKWNQIQTNGSFDYVIWNGKKYLVDTKRPLKNLRMTCEKHKIPLIEPKRQYDRYNYDPHPNKIGNIRMAQDIVDFLVNTEPFREYETRAVARTSDKDY